MTFEEAMKAGGVARLLWIDPSAPWHSAPSHRVAWVQYNRALKAWLLRAGWIKVHFLAKPWPPRPDDGFSRDPGIAIVEPCTPGAEVGFMPPGWLRMKRKENRK